jgi:flavodoxin
MKSLIIYDSLYGNTEVIAHIIGMTLKEQGEVKVARLDMLSPEPLAGIQLLVVGSPTQQFRPTAAIRRFLDNIPRDGLHGVRVAAFDTRLTQAEMDKNPPLPFFVHIFGYAAARIAKKLAQKGAQLLLPPEGFFVESMKGPLVQGEVERAEAWARKLFTG